MFSDKHMLNLYISSCHQEGDAGGGLVVMDCGTSGKMLRVGRGERVRYLTCDRLKSDLGSSNNFSGHFMVG